MASPIQATTLTDAALEFVSREGGWVPGHFGIELARALRRLERRSLILPDRVDEGLRQIRFLGLRQDPSEILEVVDRIVTLARNAGLKVADAAYLDLALRLSWPLATRDAALRAAAQARRASLFTP